MYIEGFHYGPLLTQAQHELSEFNKRENEMEKEMEKDKCQCPVGGGPVVVVPGVPDDQSNTIADTCTCTVSDSDSGTDIHTVSQIDMNRGVGIVDSNTNTNTDADMLPSGGQKNGFVVYRQTVDLVNMLEKIA